MTVTIRPTFRRGAYWLAFLLLVDWLLTWCLLELWPYFVVEKNPFVLAMGPWLHLAYSTTLATAVIWLSHLGDSKDLTPWPMVPVLMWYGWLMVSNASWLLALASLTGL